MNKFPLLFFDAPTTEKRNTLKNGYPSSFLNIPIFERQVKRLGSVFSSLQTTLNTRKMYPQTSTLGLEPECTVVMEIIGAIEDFMSIVRNTEGLEWLAELNEELDPDEDFYYNDKNGNKIINKHLKNKLFISMANQKAILPVDITFRAINEIVKDNKLNQAIKIINLSVGDYYRQFNKNLSSWAKLIDYFSYKYNLLFCISIGNYSEPIDLSCTLEEWNNLSEKQRIEKILNSIKNTETQRKLLAPAESINAITVGAINDDFSNFSGDNNGLELIKNNIFPSIISRMGLGFRNSIKPDICVEGGRQLYEKPFTESQKLENLKIKDFPTKAPGLCVAYGNNKQAFLSGTSFACALASRAAVRFYEIIETNAKGIPLYISVLLKAMLVYCCSWNDFDNILKMY